MTLSLARATLLAAVFTSPVLAQTTQPLDAEAPNLIHQHHKFALNPKHPAAADNSRFTTSRPDAIQLPLPAEKDAFSFVVYGDRTSGPADGVNILADAVRDTNLLEPDLVLTVGDLIQGYNESPAWENQAKEYKSIMNRLICPWFPVAGNHDVYWRDQDKSGDAKPVGENEKKFETHFGPLWYAFEHKNSWFIVLFSDEGDVKGDKAFNRPDAQQMSDAQLNWLKETLVKAKGADHVFLFLHHPRWIGGRTAHEGYADSWDKVHAELVKAGNVTAVFGGHIHRMRYDKKDNIEYVTLAATGGGLGQPIPAAGWLHHYHVVTVRKNQVAMAAFPVNAAINVREMTKPLVDDVAKLAATNPQFSAPLELNSDGSADHALAVKLTNPTARPVEFTISPDSGDSRWVASPDHQHKVLAPGEDTTLNFRIRRGASPVDDTLRAMEMTFTAEYLTETQRYPVPTKQLTVPLDLKNVKVTQPMAIDLGSTEGNAISVPNAFIKLPGNTFTLEGWFNARSFKDRQGLLSKMQTSAYGIFVNNGRPSAGAYVGDSYLTARPPASFKLDTDRWYHIASSFDGSTISLFIDGKLVAKETRNAPFKDNELPLVIGGDIGAAGKLTDTLDGQLDAVRLSSVARYTKDFTPLKRYTADADTLLLLNFDLTLGKHILSESTPSRLLPLPPSLKLVPKPE